MILSLTSMSTSEVSTAREGQNVEQERTFDCCLNNKKIMLSKLNDDWNTNDSWIWLTNTQWYINSGCSMDVLENEIKKSFLNGFRVVWYC